MSSSKPSAAQPARRVKHVLTALAARLVRRRRVTAAELPTLRPRRILVVRQHNQMGDMVCATPALRAIARTFAGAEVALVTAPVNREVVQHNPDLARVFLFDKRSWRRPLRLLAFLRELRAWRPDVAFVLSSVSFSVTSAALALASGAPIVVGGDSRPFGWDVSRHAFSLELPSDPVVTGHAVAHSLAPLQAVGVTTDDLATVVVPAPEERQAAAAVMDDLGLAPGFWALHPGAAEVQNLWPADRFAAVAARAAAAGHGVLLLHGPADAAALAGVRSALPPEARAVRTAPACSVGVAAALLEQAGRFLCNDTGIMHVAGALHVPTLALFGPTDPVQWKPPSDAVVALRSPRRDPHPGGPEHGWMENLTVEDVWDAWRALAGRP